MLRNHTDLTIHAGAFATEEQARAAYDLARDLLHDETMTVTYDAAILTRDADGKPTIVTRHEEGVRQGALAGALVGLAGGLLLILFPAAGIGALLAGMGLGAGMGAIAGHAVAGLTRKDMAEIGEVLDTAPYALIVATDSEDQETIGQIFAGASAVTSKDLRTSAE